MSTMQERHECGECAKDDYKDCLGWYTGFDDGYQGGVPESPGECYLDGFCDGVISREEDDDEDEQPWDDEEHPDSEYEKDKEPA